ncbi:hypothetical protein F511_00237 [Dorcoceras hygrometricum]|nr:hypothetical protein F511_00237 [Dorcoceras hygrometricum]
MSCMFQIVYTPLSSKAKQRESEPVPPISGILCVVIGDGRDGDEIEHEMGIGSSPVPFPCTASSLALPPLH